MSGDDDDEGHDELGNPRPIGFEELGFQGSGAEEEREIESQLTGSGSMPHRR